MPGLRERSAVSSCVLAAVFLGTILAAAPALAEWRRLDTPNFVVAGDVPAGTLRDVAVKFEGFRETLTRVLSDRVTATAVPTIVIVFPSDRAFTPFKPKYQGKAIELSGLFVPRADVNYIAVVAERGDDGMRVVFHEYAHLVTSNVSRNLPVWVREGLAEFYSTFELSKGGQQAVIGAPIAPHLMLLRESKLLSMGELLGVRHDSPLYNEGNRRSVLYAQSWALTHMLLLGEPGRNQKLGEYLATVDQGVPAEAAWAKSFAAEPIERDLKKYIGQRTFKASQYKFSEKLATFSGNPATIPLSEAEAFLADFLIQQGRAAEAAERLAKLGPKSGNTDWHATVRALSDAANNAPEAAEKTLVSLPPMTDWLAAYRAAIGLADVLDSRGVPPSSEQLAAARRLFANAGRGRDIANAIARLGELELDANAPAPVTTRAAIERARLMAPGRDDYVFLHARMLARDRAYAEARTVLGPMMSPVQPTATRDFARRLMTYILELEKFATAGASAAAAMPAPPENMPRASGDVPEAPSTFQPILRDVKPGEERVAGVLDRIDCTQDGAALHVRTTDGAVVLNAPTLGEVDFITYRDDLTGNVACGPLKAPARVYVTSRQANGGAGRIVVAVEFLPN